MAEPDSHSPGPGAGSHRLKGDVEESQSGSTGGKGGAQEGGSCSRKAESRQGREKSPRVRVRTGAEVGRERGREGNRVW